MRRLSAKAEEASEEKAPLVPYLRFKVKKRTWNVLGVFVDEPTTHVYVQGTDKMSMGVQPKFAEFAASCRGNLVIEGDRLANSKTLQTLSDEGYEVHVYALHTSDAVRNARYRQRGSEQDPKFIAGRITKVRNLVDDAKKRGLHMQWVTHETADHLRKLVDTLASHL